MSAAVKNGKAVLRRHSVSGYLWTNPANGERFEVYSIKNVSGPGVKWHASGDKGTKFDDVDLGRVRETLASCFVNAQRAVKS